MAHTARTARTRGDRGDEPDGERRAAAGSSGGGAGGRVEAALRAERRCVVGGPWAAQALEVRDDLWVLRALDGDVAHRVGVVRRRRARPRVVDGVGKVQPALRRGQPQQPLERRPDRQLLHGAARHSTRCSPCAHAAAKTRKNQGGGVGGLKSQASAAALCEGIGRPPAWLRICDRCRSRRRCGSPYAGTPGSRLPQP